MKVQPCGKSMNFSRQEISAVDTISRNISERVFLTIMYDAASRRSMETIKWLREIGRIWDHWVVVHAISEESDSFRMVKWLIEEGCPMSGHAIQQAAYVDRLDIIKLLRYHDCPWPRHAIQAAEYKDHPEVVQWLRENGCPE